MGRAILAASERAARLPLVPWWAVLGALLLLSGACSNEGADGAPPSTARAMATTAAPGTTTTAAPAAADGSAPVWVVTTAGDPSGNRVIMGRADLTADPIEVELGSVASWVVGAARHDRVTWVVADVDGNVAAFVEEAGEARPGELGSSAVLPAGAAPVLVAEGRGVTVLQTQLTPPDAVTPAPLAGHTIVEGRQVLIGDDGAVFVGDEVVAGVAALVDGRIAVSARGEVAFLSGPTDRLAHGVLGDLTEAESVVVLEPGRPTIQATLAAPEDTVFEALAPLWGDVDGDGIEELIVTASDVSGGARLVAFRPDGTVHSQSAAIGQGSRWLNQLAVGPVGPDGGIEVVEVRTPHIGGEVRWYRSELGSLELQAAVGDYSTHRIGSRNVDQGIVVDADGDGTLDVLVPTQDQRTLAALTRVERRAVVTLSVPLGAELSSNLSAVARLDGTVSVALGTEDGRLLIWP